MFRFLISLAAVAVLAATAGALLLLGGDDEPKMVPQIGAPPAPARDPGGFNPYGGNDTPPTPPGSILELVAESCEDFDCSTALKLRRDATVDDVLRAVRPFALDARRENPGGYSLYFTVELRGRDLGGRATVGSLMVRCTPDQLERIDWEYIEPNGIRSICTVEML